MSRFVRVPHVFAGPGSSELPRETAHYLTHVHRARVGEEFVVFDVEAGLEASARVVGLERGRVHCELSEPRPVSPSPLRVGILQATAKGDRVEQVVRAATALGARWVKTVICERSVARPAELRLGRLQAIALDAARQSGRGDVPLLSGPTPLAQALEEPWSGLSFCAALGSEATLAHHVQAWDLESDVRILIGPEGGLSEAELAGAERAGFVRVSLGPFTLRTELAATAALANFAARLGCV
ncbi:MAG TPA: RsmE family RNA methyltransferase [Polyangiaceae bacterium]|nr:RsmE family RNA methyltransferase [Polyangiaceae bacterium]